MGWMRELAVGGGKVREQMSIKNVRDPPPPLQHRLTELIRTAKAKRTSVFVVARLWSTCQTVKHPVSSSFQERKHSSEIVSTDY